MDFCEVSSREFVQTKSVPSEIMYLYRVEYLIFNGINVKGSRLSEIFELLNRDVLHVESNAFT